MDLSPFVSRKKINPVVKPQTSDFNWSRTSATKSRIRFENVNSSLFDNNLMHIGTEKKKYNYFISALIEAIANQLSLLVHQLLHEMKTVCTILNEGKDSETASNLN